MLLFCVVTIIFLLLYFPIIIFFLLLFFSLLVLFSHCYFSPVVNFFLLYYNLFHYYIFPCYYIFFHYYGFCGIKYFPLLNLFLSLYFSYYKISLKFPYLLVPLLNTLCCQYLLELEVNNC